MIQILNGSIFDSKCDLLVIPCDSSGGVTQSVFSNLADRGLPTSMRSVKYGSVYFREANYEFASTIAYAASVDVDTISSDCNAITNIAEQIAKYARDNQIRTVNVPLLGAGAGGLSLTDSFLALRDGFRDESGLFNIFCVTRETYRNVLSVADIAIESEVIRSPRVFISYTGNCRENANWTRRLAETLRKNGVDARIDVFHLKPGFDLPQWMTNEVIMADKVLLVCDRHYMEKADFKKGGVGWETMIIQGDMLAQGDNKNKYIAIVREEAMDEALPIYLRSRYALNWGTHEEIDEESLQELILHLYDCEFETTLGEVPSFVRSRIRGQCN